MNEATFLKEKYNLHSAPEVASAAKRTQRRTGERVPNDPVSQIENYLNRFKEIVERKDVVDRERGVNALKKIILDKFVTKYEDIPDSYWSLQENILRERGQAGDWGDLSPEQKESARRQNAETT